jgi:predicted solute-binding protein
VIGRGLDSLRLGCVQYLNAQPLIHGWPGEVVLDHPSALCRMLGAAELDVAFVSSFEFLRNPDYAVVDDVAVAADGAVYSVFLAHSGAIEEVNEITLDPASQTSVNLLRCLLAERGINAHFAVADAAATPITRTCARLMIGDQAIRFRQANGSAYNLWDLAEEWKRVTTLPFVFALWLIRPEVENAREIADALRHRRDENLAALEEVIASNPEHDPAFCDYYLRQCVRFHFGAAEKAGLLKFQELCEKHAILPPQSRALRLL